MICIGMDVSKGKSTVCIRRQGGETIREPFELQHTEEDLDALCTFLEELSQQEEVRVVMEATGIYHLPILLHLKGAGAFVCVVNPLVMKKFAAQAIRRGKNDKRDAMKIAAYGLEKWYTLEDYSPSQKVYEELRLLGRQYMHYITVKISCKQNLSCLLERTMPGIASLLESSHAVTAEKDKLLDFVSQYWHYDNITRMSQRAFVNHYARWAHKHGYHTSERKAAEIYGTAQQAIPSLPFSPCTKLLLERAVHALQELNRDAAAILIAMQELAQQLPEYAVVRQMEGVGEVLAPRLIAEIGDVRRYHSPSALVAYAGIDSPEFQSGAFAATTRHISKRGSSLLRKTCYEVMQSLKRLRCEESPIYQYMLKKEEEGKHKKVAKVAGMNKFLRIYYARVRDCYAALSAQKNSGSSPLFSS